MSLLLALTASGGGAVNYTLSCATGAYAYAGNAASLKQAHALTLAPGAYAFSGKAATLTVSRKLALVPGAYNYAGQAATLTYTPGAGAVAYTLACTTGAYAYAGNSATLTYASGAAAASKSGVNRLWLIEHYTKAFAAKEAALKNPSTVKAKAAARKRAAEHEAEVESLVAKAEADIETLTQGIKDAQAAQTFTYNLLKQAQSLPDMALEIDFLAIANGYRERVRREDDDLLLLSMVL